MRLTHLHPAQLHCIAETLGRIGSGWNHHLHHRTNRDAATTPTVAPVAAAVAQSDHNAAVVRNGKREWNTVDMMPPLANFAGDFQPKAGQRLVFEFCDDAAHEIERF